jgi:hypothetical protein
LAWQDWLLQFPLLILMSSLQLILLLLEVLVLLTLMRLVGFGQYHAGLEYAYQLDLDFQVTDNVLLENIYWDVYVNGSDIGDWSWTPVASTGLVSLSFGFSDITGNGTYEIAMLVSNEVSSGYGSIALGVPGTMTLYGDSGIAPVPEPATMLLLGSGLVGLAAFGRKKLFKKS